MKNLIRVLLIAAICCGSATHARADEPSVEFTVKLDVIKQELSPQFCWFHPRLAAVPGAGQAGKPLIILTLQKHLVVDDFYSGLYYMKSADLGKTWTEPALPPEIDWTKTDNKETLSVADVTPGWHPQTGKVIAIGIRLRYSAAGAQLVDKPRSHTWGYAVYDPKTDKWEKWKTLELPDPTGEYFLVDPGCAQWLVKPDGTLLVPIYYQGSKGGPYSVTVVEATFDGSTMKYIRHGDELHLNEVRGLCEPSLVTFKGKYYLTLRNDNRGYVTVSDDGQKFAPIKPWTFDNGQDLGSYNTQQHWLVHSDGLFLSYTRRGANNDHIARNRAPIFLAQVDAEKLHVIRATEKSVLPERGVMLGNFGAAAVDQHESWITDSEYIANGKGDPRGADGSTFAGRIIWSKPNLLMGRDHKSDAR